MATRPRLARTPAAGPALVSAAKERARRAQEDLQVEERGAVLDVPEIELDPLGPRELRAAVDLRPAGDAGSHVEPVSLPVVVLLDLVAERRPRPDDRHVAAYDVPELGQLVEREPTQDAADTRD